MDLKARVTREFEILGPDRVDQAVKWHGQSSPNSYFYWPMCFLRAAEEGFSVGRDLIALRQEMGGVSHPRHSGLCSAIEHMYEGWSCVYKCDPVNSRAQLLAWAEEWLELNRVKVAEIPCYQTS